MDFVKFKDKVFESSIKKVLKKPQEYVLTEEDLNGIDGILISDKDVNGFGIPWTGDNDAFNMIFPNLIFNIKSSENDEWQSDLALLKNIKTLHLYVPMQSLYFLKEFSLLRELYLVNQLETKWMFLEDLVSLKFIAIKNVDFPDISPLVNLYKKQEEAFNVNRQEVKKPSLRFFNGLTNILLEYCNIVDISKVSACSKLREINLSHNNITDITSLGFIEQLYYLTLRYNNITDISALKNSNNIYYLNLRHNHIKDISIFKILKNSNLNRLFLGDNPIDDYDPLFKLNLLDSDI